jgi:hypothetical protein
VSARYFPVFGATLDNDPIGVATLMRRLRIVGTEPAATTWGDYFDRKKIAVGWQTQMTPSTCEHGCTFESPGPSEWDGVDADSTARRRQVSLFATFR